MHPTAPPTVDTLPSCVKKKAGPKKPICSFAGHVQQKIHGIWLMYCFQFCSPLVALKYKCGLYMFSSLLHVFCISLRIQPASCIYIGLQPSSWCCFHWATVSWVIRITSAEVQYSLIVTSLAATALDYTVPNRNIRVTPSDQQTEHCVQEHTNT